MHILTPTYMRYAFPLAQIFSQRMLGVNSWCDILTTAVGLWGITSQAIPGVLICLPPFKDCEAILGHTMLARRQAPHARSHTPQAFFVAVVEQKRMY